MSWKSKYEAAKKGAQTVKKGAQTVKSGAQTAKSQYEQRKCACGCRKNVYGPPGSYRSECAMKQVNK